MQFHSNLIKTIDYIINELCYAIYIHSIYLVTTLQKWEVCAWFNVLKFALFLDLKKVLSSFFVFGYRATLNPPSPSPNQWLGLCWNKTGHAGVILAYINYLFLKSVVHYIIWRFKSQFHVMRLLPYHENHFLFNRKFQNKREP